MAKVMVIRFSGRFLCVSAFIFFLSRLLLRTFFALRFSVSASWVLRPDFNIFPLKHINVAVLLLIRLFSLCLRILKGWLHWTGELLLLQLCFFFTLISCFLHIPLSRAFIYINLFAVYLIFNEFQSARVHVQYTYILYLAQKPNKDGHEQKVK